MNFFAHALPFLDNPYFAVGTCVPDMLSAFDRPCRVRQKNAAPFAAHSDPLIAAVSAGIVQHHIDDDWFHRTPTFNELILKFAVELRDLLAGERSLRPSFVGHIIVEMLLDNCLHQQHPGKLDEFYQTIATVDAGAVQTAINPFSTRPTDKLVTAIEKFVELKFLYDYATDEGILYRTNQVLRRVKLDPLDDRIKAWLPDARARVQRRSSELLEKRGNP